MDEVILRFPASDEQLTGQLQGTPRPLGQHMGDSLSEGQGQGENFR